MVKVYVADFHAIPIGEHWDDSVISLACKAALPILIRSSRKVDCVIVGNMLSGVLNRQENLATAITDGLGLSGVEAFKVEAACASGGAAMRAAYSLVRAGIHETVLVIGVEKLTDQSHLEVARALAYANDAGLESVFGITNTHLAALATQMYCDSYGISPDTFAPLVIESYRRSSENPLAFHRKPISLELYRNSASVSTPLRIFDCPSIADGAASILISSRQSPGLNAKACVEIASIRGATDSLAFANRENPMSLNAIRRSANAALSEAGCNLKSLKYLELHDAFPIVATLSVEALGLTDPGKGVAYLGNSLKPSNSESEEVHSPIIGSLGGIKGRGHPVGATGIYQLIDLFKSLEKSEENASFGLAQCMGGFGCNCFTTVIRREVSQNGT
jgi:acetyl-CoA C-acetyltransferase